MNQIKKLLRRYVPLSDVAAIKAIGTSQPLRQFECNVYFKHEFYLFRLQMNPQQYLPSHPFTHTHAGSYMRWRLVHMSYIHAEIDRYNCMHMQSCSSGLIWRRSGVKDFFQSKRVLTSGTSLSSVMKTIRKLFELKAKEPHEHLGDDRPGRVSPSFFFFRRNFSSHCRHEKIISGELNLCQRGSGK